MHKILPLIIAATALFGCKSSQLKHTPETGMFKISILYPNEPGKTFDMDYYAKTHMPLMASILGKNLKFYEIDKGISGRTSKDPAPYVAIGYFYCYSVAEYDKSIAQNIEAIISDIKKYTNIQPIAQISEIKHLKYTPAQ